MRPPACALTNYPEADEASSYYSSWKSLHLINMATPTIDARTAVLNRLHTKDFRPLELLRTLGDQGYSDSDVKEAISELLREAVIQLTNDRILRVAVAA